MNTPTQTRGRPREFDRNEALLKAMRVFWTLGYEAASMADLRTALGVTQASLYAAFGSKEELFREAVNVYRQTTGITTARALGTEPTARAAVEAMLRDAVEVFTADGSPSGCFVVLGAVNCTVKNRPVQEYLVSLRRETQQAVRARLERGRREGDVPKEAAAEAAAAFYTTVLHGLSIQARDGSSHAELMSVVDGAMASWPQIIGVTEKS